ncbi:hypothetical protein [Amycolatopsis viridis]|uniref:Secreted protein n=1 Tax=Amycolatopsis viridis TaxID=185678 RepID=A0ABX0SNM2_9PSEU|nr:hypothetical protein [Amycolatopsis viridis]NIH78571.1 hypothetical protein [Amycolatopsis viridis]
MKFRKMMLTAATLTVTAASALTITGTATATTSPAGGWDHVWAGGDATVYAEETGDVIKVCDTKADGQPVYVKVSSGGQWKYTVWAKGGLGSCAERSEKDKGVYDLIEGREIEVEFGTGNGPHHVGRFLNAR